MSPTGDIFAQRVDAIFDEAVTVTADRRTAWLDARCAGDADLRAEVERLLLADARQGGLLETMPVELDRALVDAVSAPARVGVWRVLDRIGAGGMGEVWLAERDDAGFVQRAAIKQVAWPTPALLRRFEHERRILARLEHPGIARLIDGGSDPEAGPFLAMEYVDGQRIDTWVRDRALDVRAIVVLLLQVCDAVQYAHRNLVVHSDLKPSNILVGADGAPRLLDFGIARAISEDGAASVATRTRLMTPDYAAPEMLRDGTVTTAADVYALGVLACELLAGRRPPRPDFLAASLAEARMPSLPVPSAVLSRDLADWRSRRHTLRGDLDRIVAKAVDPDLARRYGSVEALAADFGRWLDGHAVLARGDGTWYRLRKLVGRNRVATVVVVVAALALAIATATSIDFALRERQQATRALAVRAFLVDIFARADPTAVEQGKLTAQQLVIQSQHRLSDMVDMPHGVRADLLVMLGQFYWNLADYESTRANLLEALQLAEVGGVSTDVEARALVALGILECDSGEQALAWEHLQRALVLLDKMPAEDVQADARMLRARLSRWHDGAAVAEARLSQQIDEDGQRFGGDSVQVVESLIQRAEALLALARYGDAERELGEAARLTRTRAGNGRRSRYALSMSVLGESLRARGDYAGAEQAWQESARTVESLWGKSLRYAIVERRLHQLETLRGRPRQAVALMERDLAQMPAEESRHAALQGSLNVGLGDALLLGGDFVAAESAYRGGPVAASSTPVSWYGVALALDRQAGRGDEAEAAFRAAIADDDERREGEYTRGPALAHAAYADFLRRVGRVDDALHEAHVAATLVAAGDDDPPRAQVLATLALVQLAHGDTVAATASARDALDISRRTLPDGNWQIAPALHAAARTALAAGDLSSAEQLAERALALASPPFPEGDPRLNEYKELVAEVRAAPH